MVVKVAELEMCNSVFSPQLLAVVRSPVFNPEQRMTVSVLGHGVSPLVARISAFGKFLFCSTSDKRGIAHFSGPGCNVKLFQGAKVMKYGLNGGDVYIRSLIEVLLYPLDSVSSGGKIKPPHALVSLFIQGKGNK